MDCGVVSILKVVTLQPTKSSQVQHCRNWSSRLAFHRFSTSIWQDRSMSTQMKTTQDSKKQMASLHNEAKDALSQAYEEMDTRGHQHTYLYRPQEEVTQ